MARKTIHSQTVLVEAGDTDLSGKLRIMPAFPSRNPFGHFLSFMEPAELQRKTRTLPIEVGIVGLLHSTLLPCSVHSLGSAAPPPPSPRRKPLDVLISYVSLIHTSLAGPFLNCELAGSHVTSYRSADIIIRRN